MRMIEKKLKEIKEQELAVYNPTLIGGFEIIYEVAQAHRNPIMEDMALINTFLLSFYELDEDVLLALAGEDYYEYITTFEEVFKKAPNYIFYKERYDRFVKLQKTHATEGLFDGLIENMTGVDLSQVKDTLQGAKEEIK